MLKWPKALMQRILSASVRRAVRDPWEDLRDWIGAFAFGLRFVATRTPRPKILLYFGYAPGDDLLCTAVMRELRKRGRDGLLMVSDHRELFEGNQDPAYVRPLWARYSRDRSTVSICRRFVRIWGGEFTRLEYAPMDGKDRRRSPSRHVIAEMCARVGVYRPGVDQAIPDIGREGEVACSLGQRSCRHPKQRRGSTSPGAKQGMVSGTIPRRL